MLKTETNTPEIRDEIYQAASARFPEFEPDLHFEHGQWWLCHSNGAQYSVVDAEGGESINGFDFEQVTPPDEE